MIYYWIHVIWIFFSSRILKKKIDVDSSISSTFRVSILDCEGLKYMTNSRYCYYMDFIRYEFLFRTPLFKSTISEGMFAVLGSQKLIYKKPLKRWTKFEVKLNVEGWNENWVFLKHVFTRNGDVYAIGFTRQTFWKGRKAQNMHELLVKSGYTGPEKNVPVAVQHLFEKDADIIHMED